MNRRLMAGIASLAVVVGASACTPQEVRGWIAWHDSDPAAAEEFANQPEVQADLATGEHEQQVAAESSDESSGRGGCDGIYDEMIRQGAGSGVASRFAYHIAPRESGCSPQFVHDHDDWSYSRFGLNGLTAGLRAGWMRLCGADVRSDTKSLSKDVECALAGYNAMGWRPWS
jgi:hypothetical protein